MQQPMNVHVPDADGFVQVHYRVGLALWQIQAFEYTLTYFITLLLKLPPSRAEAEATEIMEKLGTQTLGQLINELKRANPTNSVSEFEQRVNAFLKERNWLVHKSWSMHHNDVFKPECLPPLLSRLDALTEEASQLQRRFGEMVTAWAMQQGHSKQGIEAETQRILEEWGIDR